MFETWDKNRNCIKTKKGGWIRGEGVFSHGYNLMDDLVGKVSYFQIFLLNITGKLPTKKLADWLEAEYSCMSFPDARIWCNQIGALAGSYRSAPPAGILAGTLAADSRMYGPGTARDVFKFLCQAKKELERGATIEEIVYKRSRRSGIKPIIPGFGRPLATGDERVIRMEGVAAALGFEIGETLRLAYDIEKFLLENYEESMNLATYTVAFLVDQNFTLHQIQACFSLMVAAGVAACFMEALENPADTFLPLRCDDIRYIGPESRSVPNRK